MGGNRGREALGRQIHGEAWLVATHLKVKTKEQEEFFM
jgi:hypothetical protein